MRQVPVQGPMRADDCTTRRICPAVGLGGNWALRCTVLRRISSFRKAGIGFGGCSRISHSWCSVTPIASRRARALEGQTPVMAFDIEVILWGRHAIAVKEVIEQVI
jgi:hypothetical protein